MRIISLNYDSTTNTLVCTSTGGPVTTVLWSKENSSGITNDPEYYEQSMAIISTTTATYESRLRILNKSSESTGDYTCMVSNSRGSSAQSIHIEGKSGHDDGTVDITVIQYNTVTGCPFSVQGHGTKIQQSGLWECGGVQ